MKKTLIIIGVLLLAMPFLGFPSAWKSAFFVFAGLLLLFFALFNRRISGGGAVSVRIEEETFIEAAPEKE